MTVATLIIASLSVIPEELTPRDALWSPLIGVGLSLAFVLITVSRLIRVDIFENLLVSEFKIGGLQTYLRDAFPLNRAGSFLLLANYILSAGLVLYLIPDVWSGFAGIEWWVAVAVPAAVLLWSLTGMVVVGWITGERQTLQDPIAMKLIGAEFLGIFYFLLALVLFLYPFEGRLFVEIAVIAFIVESTLRVIKSVVAVSAWGVSWYYIILYFCTLEILPLFVAYYVVLRDFETSLF